MAINGCTVRAVKTQPVCLLLSHRIGTTSNSRGSCGWMRMVYSQPHARSAIPNPQFSHSPIERYHQDGLFPLNRVRHSGSDFSPLLISHKVLRGPDTPYHRAARHHH